MRGHARGGEFGIGGEFSSIKKGSKLECESKRSRAYKGGEEDFEEGQLRPGCRNFIRSGERVRRPGVAYLARRGFHRGGGRIQEMSEWLEKMIGK